MRKVAGIFATVAVTALVLSVPHLAAQQAVRAETATVPLELVVALLGATGSPDQVPELRIGGLPSSIPADIVPSGGRVLGTIVYARDAVRRGGANTAILVVDRFPEDAMNAFAAHLEKTGWVAPPSPTPRGGFSAMPMTSRPTFFCRDSAYVNYSATLRPAGGSHLRVQYMYAPSTGYSPCDPERRAITRQPQLDEVPIPPMHPPANAMLVGSESNSGGMDGRVMSVRLDTPQPPVLLAAHYAEQLRKAGWTAGAVSSFGAGVAQVFESRDAKGRALRGVLTVFSVPGGTLANERDLSFRIARSVSHRP